jgi:hypothetical protein
MVGFLVLASCAQGHCRRQVEAPAPPQPVDASSAADTAAPKANSDRVFVYKYDGSLQCKMGKAIAPEVMAKQLTGIPVLSSTKKADGLMHIQVCGSITGKANVFEIPAKYQKQAESLGFKTWSFD